MSVSFGPFLTCFLAIGFLAAYLYVILYHTKSSFVYHTKFIFLGLLLICIRLMIPLNFPFTYTIYSEKILPRFTQYIYAPVGDSRFLISDILLLLWLIGACICLFRFGLKKWKLHRFLKNYILSENLKGKIPEQYLQFCVSSKIQIALIPAHISPAITGTLHPTLILSEQWDLSEKELHYILAHELQHYKNHDLWVKSLLEMIACIHWWNPLIYLVKKEYSLALEIANDSYLARHESDFDSLYYAELLIKIARQVDSRKTVTASDAISFVGRSSSNLKTRVSVLLNSRQPKKNRPNMITGISALFIAIFFSSLVVIEPWNPIAPSQKENSFSIEDDKVYIIETNSGYKLYVNDKFYSDLKEVPKEFESLIKDSK